MSEEGHIVPPLCPKCGDPITHCSCEGETGVLDRPDWLNEPLDADEAAEAMNGDQYFYDKEFPDGE